MEYLPDEILSLILDYTELDPNICCVNTRFYNNCASSARLFIKRYNPVIYQLLEGDSPITKYRHLISNLRLTKYSALYKSKLALAKLILNKTPIWSSIYKLLDQLNKYINNSSAVILMGIPDKLKYLNLDSFSYNIGLTVGYSNINTINDILDIILHLNGNNVRHKQMVLLGLTLTHDDEIWYEHIFNNRYIPITTDFILDLYTLSNGNFNQLLNYFRLDQNILNYPRISNILSGSSYDSEALSYKLRHRKLNNLNLFSADKWLSAEVLRYIDMLDRDTFISIKDIVPKDIWILKAIESGDPNLIIELLDYTEDIDYIKVLLELLGHDDFYRLFNTIYP